jgi:hypothetical protein
MKETHWKKENSVALKNDVNVGYLQKGKPTHNNVGKNFFVGVLKVTD